MRRGPLIACLLCLAACAAQAQTPAPGSAGVPVNFARGGGNSDVVLTGGGPLSAKRNVVLTAFGRTWTAPVDVSVTSLRPRARVAVPKVRVPTVFSLVDQDRRLVGELVVYPDRNVEWDGKIIVYSSGAPAWFEQWTAATGLPIKPIKPDDLRNASFAQAGDDARTLLVLGRAAAGKDLDGAQKLANEKGINLLVLDADWFADSAGPATVGGGQMRGDLLAITGKQSWASMLEFRSARQPCGAVANRWAWIADKEGLPSVERLAVASTTLAAVRPVVLSYLPWAEQLGRKEQADSTLLALLSAAAGAASVELKGHPVRFVYPPQEKLDPNVRPVLCAIRSVEPVPRPDQKPDYNLRMIHVVDLRGHDAPAADADALSRQYRDALEGQAAATLLILGDDPLLDEWKWLKMDRAKKTIDNPRVTWIPDDELPPSSSTRIELMLKLTELGMPLGKPPEGEATTEKDSVKQPVSAASNR